LQMLFGIPICCYRLVPFFVLLSAFLQKRIFCDIGLRFCRIRTNAERFTLPKRKRCCRFMSKVQVVTDIFRAARKGGSIVALYRQGICRANSCRQVSLQPTGKAASSPRNINRRRTTCQKKMWKNC
jgi:hypothetical protein